MRYNPLIWVLKDSYGGATIALYLCGQFTKRLLDMVLVVSILVCDTPAILRVKIVVVVILAILVPGWVSQQDPGDFNLHFPMFYFDNVVNHHDCGIGIFK